MTPIERYYQLLGSKETKIESLQDSISDKVGRLGEQVQGESLQDTFSTTPSGYVESNKNKVWNNYSGANIQQALAEAAGEHQLRRDEATGKVYNIATGEEYTGDTRRAYMYGTKTDKDAVKFGLARGDLDSSDYRYQPGKVQGYGWDAGKDGVDTNKKYMDMLLPYNVATALEGMVHGRKEALDNRKYKDIFSKEALEHGSGVSEYYKSAEGMLGDVRKERGPVTQDLLEKNAQMRGAQAPVYESKQDMLWSGLANQKQGYLSNLVDAAQYGVGSALARAGDAIVDAGLRASKEARKAVTGETEAELNAKMANDVKGTFLEGIVDTSGNFTGVDKYKEAGEYGYDSSRVDTYSKELIAIMKDEKAPWYKKAGKFLAGIQHAPEVLASSSGDILLAMTGVPGMAAMGAGFMNEVLDERQKINGRPNEAADYAIALPAAIAYTAVNKLTGGTAGIKETASVVRKALQQVDAGTAKKIYDASVGLALKAGKNGLEEGLEEVFQGYAEEIGTKLATSKQGEILSEDTAYEQLAAGALGFGAGAGVSVAKESPAIAGGILHAGSETVNAQLDKIAQYKDEIEKRKAGGDAEATVQAPDPVQEDGTVVNTYAEDLLKIHDLVSGDAVDEKAVDEIAGKYKDDTDLQRIVGELKAGNEETKAEMAEWATEYRAAVQRNTEAAKKADRDTLLNRESGTVPDKLGASWADLDEDGIVELATRSYEVSDAKDAGSVTSAITSILKKKVKEDGTKYTTKEITELLRPAKAVAGALATLAPRADGKKSTGQVAGEVSGGARGAVTYYNNVNTALKSGNMSVADENMRKLEKLHASQMNKAKILESNLASYEADLKAEVAAQAKMTGRSMQEVAWEMKRAVEDADVGKGARQRTGIEVEYGRDDYGKPVYVRIPKGTVLENIARDGKVQENGLGIYGVLDTVLREADAVDTLRNAALATASKPKRKTKPKVKKEEEPKKEPVDGKKEKAKKLEEEIKRREAEKLEKEAKEAEERAAVSKEYSDKLKEASTEEEIDAVASDEKYKDVERREEMATGYKTKLKPKKPVPAKDDKPKEPVNDDEPPLDMYDYADVDKDGEANVDLGDLEEKPKKAEPKAETIFDVIDEAEFEAKVNSKLKDDKIAVMTKLLDMVKDIEDKDMQSSIYRILNEKAIKQMKGC